MFRTNSTLYFFWYFIVLFLAFFYQFVLFDFQGNDCHRNYGSFAERRAQFGAETFKSKLFPTTLSRCVKPPTHCACWPSQVEDDHHERNVVIFGRGSKTVVLRRTATEGHRSCDQGQTETNFWQCQKFISQCDSCCDPRLLTNQWKCSTDPCDTGA